MGAALLALGCSSVGDSRGLPSDRSASVVYVALGSHASYFTVGFHGLPGVPHVIPPRFTGLPLTEPDFTSAESSYGPSGTAARPLGLVDISAGTLPWLSFAGSWGDGEYVLVGRKTSVGTVFTHLRVGNSPPVANAGPNQDNITAGTVTLDGSASYDPDGDAITYSWSQTSGPTVALAAPTSAKTTFTAVGNSLAAGS